MMRGFAEGRLELDRSVVEEMYFCLACRACESACPAGVRYGHLVETMRAEIDARRARGVLERLLSRILLRGVVGRPRALRLAGACLRAYQRSGLQRLVRGTRVLALLPPLRRAERLLPSIPEPHRPPLLVPARGQRRGRVALFRGCLMAELFGPVNEATVEVLARNGFEVEIPEGQGCCGALSLHAGDPRGAERMHRRNRAAFRVQSVDSIVVNSAGCGAALRGYGDPISAKVRDVTELLHEAGLRGPLGPIAMRVAYDDACHLLHGQRISRAPRAVLRAIPRLELFDLPGSRDCCGAAGIYNLTHPETSARLLARKVEAVAATRPDAVATGNPGCILQIAMGLREARLDVPCLHPVELLARSYASAERAQRAEGERR
jgi:glycolate oxidase iron-sulfur subunit